MYEILLLQTNQHTNKKLQILGKKSESHPWELFGEVEKSLHSQEQIIYMTVYNLLTQVHQQTI